MADPNCVMRHVRAANRTWKNKDEEDSEDSSNSNRAVSSGRGHRNSSSNSSRNRSSSRSSSSKRGGKTHHSGSTKRLKSRDYDKENRTSNKMPVATRKQSSPEEETIKRKRNEEDRDDDSDATVDVEAQQKADVEPKQKAKKKKTYPSKQLAEEKEEELQDDSNAEEEEDDDKEEQASTKQKVKSTKATGKSTKATNHRDLPTGKKGRKGNDDDEGGNDGEGGNDSDDEKKKLRAQLEALMGQLKQTQVNLKVAKRGTGRKPRKSEMTKDERDWTTIINQAVKNYCINRAKFINNDKKLDNCTKMVLAGLISSLSQFDGLKGKKLESAKRAWVGKNRELVRTAMNEVRNYCGSNIRHLAVSLMVKGETIPTSDQFLLCATRCPSLMESPEGMALFDEYVDVWLVKAGLLEHWDKAWRHHQPLSSAEHVERAGEFGTNHPCITPGTEAFLQTVIKNGERSEGKNAKGEKIVYDRLQYHAECKSKGQTVDRSDQRNGCPFINSKGGVQHWGGWNEAGQVHWKTVREQIREAREQDHVEQMEADCLRRLRIKHGLEKDPEASDEDEGDEANAKPKKKVAYDDSDDEFAGAF